MIDIERISLRNRAILFAPLFVISLVGCGSDSGETTPELTTPAPEDNVETIEETFNAPNIETEFFANGTSTVSVTADFSVNTDTLIVRWCEGQDLVSLASILQTYDAGGGSESRSPLHYACEDGRLTASDFITKD